MKIQPQLYFKCPINLNQLKGDGDNKFCDQCSKCVTDFSENKGKLDLYKNDPEPCGIFKPEQLYKPFGDFRDYFVTFYQKSIQRKKASNFKFSAVVAISSLMLFMVSCGNRRMAGMTSDRWNYDQNDEKCDSTSTQDNKTEDDIILFN